MSGRVAGKVALITGGASGLGAADARLLAREGAKVVITDVQEDLGRRVAAEIPGALFLKHDVRSEDDWKAAVAKTIEAFGKLDVLVNNAGVVRFGTVEDLSYADYKFQVEIMLDGTFLGCKYAIPHMTKGGGGSIVNMASVGGIVGVSVIPAYAGAKGGIIAMTRSIAVHCQEQNYKIRVNAIAPGAHDTPMTRQALSQLSSDAAGLDQIQAMGQGEPEDVANLVLFLASEESRQITGTTITIDNGETMK
jgi:3(or 17)beta-hydroxysteroid dehydrogenase